MARLARIVLPGVAHHVTQRGNRRLPVFLETRGGLVGALIDIDGSMIRLVQEEA